MSIIKLRYRGHDGNVYGAFFLMVSHRAIRLTKDRKEKKRHKES